MELCCLKHNRKWIEEFSQGFAIHSGSGPLLNAQSDLPNTFPNLIFLVSVNNWWTNWLKAVLIQSSYLYILTILPLWALKVEIGNAHPMKALADTLSLASLSWMLIISLDPPYWPIILPLHNKFFHYFIQWYLTSQHQVSKVWRLSPHSCKGEICWVLGFLSMWRKGPKLEKPMSHLT